MEDEIYSEYVWMIIADLPHTDACRNVAAQWGMEVNEVDALVRTRFMVDREDSMGVFDD